MGRVEERAGSWFAFSWLCLLECSVTVLLSVHPSAVEHLPATWSSASCELDVWQAATLGSWAMRFLATRCCLPGPGEWQLHDVDGGFYVSNQQQETRWVTDLLEHVVVRHPMQRHWVVIGRDQKALGLKEFSEQHSKVEVGFDISGNNQPLVAYAALLEHGFPGSKFFWDVCRLRSSIRSGWQTSSSAWFQDNISLWSRKLSKAGLGRCLLIEAILPQWPQIEERALLA